MHGNWILVFLCFAGEGVVVFLGDHAKNPDKTFWFFALTCGALASLIMVWNFIDAMGSGMSYLSIGFYLALLAEVAELLAAYIYRNPCDSIKSGFDSLKQDIEEKTKTDNPAK